MLRSRTFLMPRMKISADHGKPDSVLDHVTFRFPSYLSTKPSTAGSPPDSTDLATRKISPALIGGSAIGGAFGLMFVLFGLYFVRRRYQSSVGRGSWRDGGPILETEDFQGTVPL